MIQKNLIVKPVNNKRMYSISLNDARCNACHKKYLKEKMKKNADEIQSI